MKCLLIAFAFAATLFCAAQAQGLTGVAPEYRFGRSDEQTLLADQRYDFYKRLAVSATVVVALVSMGVSAKMIRSSGRQATGRAAVYSIGGPVVTHVVGTLLLNSLG